MDGTSIEGNIKDIDRKKGLIEYVKIKGTDGKKHKLKAEQIKEMYLPPSGFSKFMNSYSFLTDATAWGDTDLNKDIIGKGYAYFENAEVRVKKKTRTLLMQLLNPSFSNNIKVYHDPYAKETASVGVGGMKLAGGDAKSYYILNKKVAYKLKKKDYDEEYKLLFKGCDEVLNNKMKWSQFEESVYTHSKSCQ